MAKRVRRRRRDAVMLQPVERASLAHLVAAPNAAELIPRMQPAALHRVIEACGLQDCADLVAMATPQQLQQVFDLDLWRAPRPGLDEELDADRFGVWLEVLMAYGPAAAAAKIVAMDPQLMIAALARHVLVFDRATQRPYERVGFDVGNYVVAARRQDAFDTIVDLLLFLDAEHPDYFHRLMRGCRRHSNSRPEIDGLHDLLTDDEQDVFDLAVAREQRRERQGYVTPAEARAFLQAARQVRARERSPSPETASPSSAALQKSARLAHLQSHLEAARNGDGAAYSAAIEQLAHLANTMVAGCSIQSRSFTPREASDAVAAVCNLGLEKGEAGLDLIAAFQIGWALLYRDVCMHTAERLLQVLETLACEDDGIQSGLTALRIELARHSSAGTPWRARDALDVMLILDQPAWAALLGLLDECPVIHSALRASNASSARAIDASAFEFISERAQIASAHQFMASLSDLLRG